MSIRLMILLAGGIVRICKRVNLVGLVAPPRPFWRVVFRIFGGVARLLALHVGASGRFQHTAETESKIAPDVVPS